MGKCGTDTKSENNPVKSDETYVQIFICHFDPFWIICSRKVFCEIIVIIFFQTSPSPVLSGANDPNLCFVLFHYFFNLHCSNFCFYEFLLVFGTYTKKNHVFTMIW